jgi:hypothetical protein
MKVEKGTLMEEIYGRVAKWIGVLPNMIRLGGRLYSNGKKIVNIEPNVAILDDLNRITVLKIEIQNFILYNVKIANNKDDISQMRRIKVGDQIYELYNFLRIINSQEINHF